MNHMQKLLLVIAASMILGGCTLGNAFNKKPASLDVATSAPATIYLGEKELGKTPYKNAEITPGQYSLRIIPDDSSLAPYEASVDLKKGSSIVISRTFGTTSLESFGYTLSLVPEQSDKATLSVISEPDTSSLTLDGVPSGFTPLSKRQISAGTHEVKVGTPGYSEQKISVNAVIGHNLIVSTKLKAEPLALSVEPTPAPQSPLTPDTTPSPSATASVAPSPRSSLAPVTPSAPPTRPYVTVGDSPDVVSAGGLNVRQEPSSSASSLGKAAIGEHLKYLGETTTAGWHKVEFEGSVGYVSAKYATLTR